MRIDYRALKQQIRLLDLLTKLGWKHTKGRGEQLRGPCPLPACSARSGGDSVKDSTFSIHAAKNVYQCFRCHSAGNVVDFWRTYRNIPPQPAAIELSQMLDASHQKSE